MGTMCAVIVMWGEWDGGRGQTLENMPEDTFLEESPDPPPLGVTKLHRRGHLSVRDSSVTLSIYLFTALSTSVSVDTGRSCHSWANVRPCVLLCSAARALGVPAPGHARPLLSDVLTFWLYYEPRRQLITYSPAQASKESAAFAGGWCLETGSGWGAPAPGQLPVGGNLPGSHTRFPRSLLGGCWTPQASWQRDA